MTDTACGRDPLVDAISTFLAHVQTPGLPEIRATLGRTIDEAGPAGLDSLGRRLSHAGTGWGYFPHDPLARRIHHVLAAPVLQHAPIVSGTEHLDAVSGKPLVILANHLSYSDANAIEVMLQLAGQGALADRLTVIAGPKVYSNVSRRFSSLCFGTIKIPQSSSRSSGDAVMNAREVARAARRSIEIARERARAWRSAADLSGRVAQPQRCDAAAARRRRALSRIAWRARAADGIDRHRAAVPDR